MEDSAHAWLQKIEGQIRELHSEYTKSSAETLKAVSEINVHLKYGQDRMDRMSERVSGSESRIDMLELSDEKRKGEMIMLRWIFGGIGLVAVAFQPLIAWLKG